MRDDYGNGGVGGRVVPAHFDPDEVPESRHGEAILLRHPLSVSYRPGGLNVMLIGGTSADTLLAGFVLSECDGIGRIETLSDTAAAAARLSSGRRFDVAFLDCDFGDMDVNAAAKMLSAVPALVLLAERFRTRHMAASPPRGPFAARLAKPLHRGQCEYLFQRLFG